MRRRRRSAADRAAPRRAEELPRPGPPRPAGGPAAPPGAGAGSPLRRRRALAALRVRLARLLLPRLRVRVVQALEVVRVGDRHLEEGRARVGQLAAREEL